MASNAWKMVAFVQAGNNPLTWDSASTAQFYLMALASIILGTVLFVLLAAQKIQEALDLEIQERTAREKTLRLAALVFENSAESMMITDADGTILNVNPAFTSLTGYTAADAIGQTPRMLKSDRQNTEFYASMWNSLLTTGTWQGELWNRHKSGDLFAERLTINSIRRPDGTTERRVALFHDITAQKRSEEVIYHQAHFDALTGLPNRYFFFDQLSKELSRARRVGGRVGLLFMDLNKFKPVNDQYGHDAGDQVLKTVAERWLASTRNSDTLARLGGDEFALIVDGLKDASELATIAQKLIAALTEPIDLPRGARCTVGTSVGGSIYPDSATEMDSLVAAADAAMYGCKAAGGGHYRLSSAAASSADAIGDWVVFDNSHLVGVAIIDEQHRRLVQMVNHINRSIKEGCTEQALREQLVALIAYTRTHFDTEHALMLEHGYSGQGIHDRQHAELLRQAEQLVERLMPGDELTLLQTLKDWLVGHILNSDKPLGAYLVGRGVS
jgi:diguanylate cyclase (GGDEF)-like protein/hemerythrin-like metal-binding protein/PAS domain S-box-containing protein